VWAGSVNNVEFSMGDLVSRIRVLQGVNRYQGGQVDLSTVPFEYLQNLMNAEILRQASPQLGIATNAAEIDAEIRRQFSPAAVPGQESDPGQLDREYQNSYQAFLTATGLTDGDYRIITEEQLALRRLVGALAQTIESPMEQVEVQWIRLPVDRAQSGGVQPEDVVRRLAIEDFSVVAQEVSQSGGFARQNGYVGWVPRGTFPDLDQALYGDPERGLTALVPGETSTPIYTSDAIYIVKLLSGPQIQELDNLVRNKLNLELVRKWQEERLLAGSESGAVKMKFNSKLYAWVADQVFITAPRLPADQVQPAN
jgi:parvulin-like peptidyl-prolyl isomerase